LWAKQFMAFLSVFSVGQNQRQKWEKQSSEGKLTPDLHDTDWFRQRQALSSLGSLKERYSTISGNFQRSWHHSFGHQELRFSRPEQCSGACSRTNSLEKIAEGYRGRFQSISDWRRKHRRREEEFTRDSNPEALHNYRRGEEWMQWSDLNGFWFPLALEPEKQSHVICATLKHLGYLSFSIAKIPYPGELRTTTLQNSLKKSTVSLSQRCFENQAIALRFNVIRLTLHYIPLRLTTWSCRMKRSCLQITNWISHWEIGHRIRDWASDAQITPKAKGKSMKKDQRLDFNSRRIIKPENKAD
jgi:hypothetical protein